ncbi:MAG: hypothetical protein ABL931_17515 [Usitatibacteraceae bacterium]
MEPTLPPTGFGRIGRGDYDGSACLNQPRNAPGRVQAIGHGLLIGRYRANEPSWQCAGCIEEKLPVRLVFEGVSGDGRQVV